MSCSMSRIKGSHTHSLLWALSRDVKTPLKIFYDIAEHDGRGEEQVQGQGHSECLKCQTQKTPQWHIRPEGQKPLRGALPQIQHVKNN